MEYKSFLNGVRHRKDRILHTGYDYRGKVFKRSLSNVFYLDAKREAILNYMDEYLVYLIDYVKMIKKTFNWTLHKHYRDFN